MKPRRRRSDAPSFDPIKISSTYPDRREYYEALLQEVVFILRDRVTNAGIKTHGIESRVKELKSILEKCDRNKVADPFSEMVDIAGARIIALYKSDMDAI